MTNKWLIDTDILIDYLRGLPQAVTFLEDAVQSTCYISSVTIAELYAGVREGKERQVLEQFLQVFNVIDINTLIAQAGGLHRRDYGKSHGVGLADAIIAATAQSLDAKLASLNKKTLSHA
jgi:predicted nucleic acid-binding protein